MPNRTVATKRCKSNVEVHNFETRSKLIDAISFPSKVLPVICREGRGSRLTVTAFWYQRVRATASSRPRMLLQGFVGLTQSLSEEHTKDLRVA